jgi:hypothetical protein
VYTTLDLLVSATFGSQAKPTVEQFYSRKLNIKQTTIKCWISGV